MRRRLLGASIATGLTACAFIVSYIALTHFYGTARRDVLIWKNVWGFKRIVPMLWADAEQSKPMVLVWEGGELRWGLTWENMEWLKYTTPSAWENAKQYNLTILTSSVDKLENVAPMLWENAEKQEPPILACVYSGDELDAYEYMRGAGAPSPPEGQYGLRTASTFVVRETRAIAVLPISACIGASIGIIFLAIWIGYRRVWGDATSTLLERGLHDMTLRDLEIVGHVMELKEFTIPELMRRTRASKITIWRIVQKLVEQGLVHPTEQKKLASNGLGGRGKPSRVYKYVGAER